MMRRPASRARRRLASPVAALPPLLLLLADASHAQCPDWCRSVRAEAPDARLRPLPSPCLRLGPRIPAPVLTRPLASAVELRRQRVVRRRAEARAVRRLRGRRRRVPGLVRRLGVRRGVVSRRAEALRLQRLRRGRPGCRPATGR